MVEGSPPTAAAVDGLRARLRALDRVVVAFSGGADSAFLAWVANDTLGPERAHAVTAVSPSLAPEEERDCAALAHEWGLRWTPVPTDELADPAYAANDGDRCYHCKASLLDVTAPLAAAEGATVVLGVNLDDLGDHRPGQRAAAERGAVFPLVDAGFDKAAVRSTSRALGLRTWDKPAAACLASRVPYGTPVTLGVLREVAAAETGLRRLGFRQLRVRHYGELARLEVPDGDLDAVVLRRTEVVAAVRAAGYRYVTLDLEGFRSGNLNAALARRGGTGAEGAAGAAVPDPPVRWLVGLVVLALVAVVALEVVVTPAAEGRIADRVAARVPEARRVEADLEGLPVVARTAATGEVPRLVVTLHDVARPEIVLERVQVRLSGVAVDRSALFGGDVVVDHVEHGRIDAEVTEEALAAVAGGLASVDLTPGRVRVTAAGVTVEARAAVADGVLVIEAEGLPALRVPLPGVDLFPCALTAEVLEGRARLSCVVDDVPEWLLGDLSRS